MWLMAPFAPFLELMAPFVEPLVRSVRLAPFVESAVFVLLKAAFEGLIKGFSGLSLFVVVVVSLEQVAGMKESEHSHLAHFLETLLSSFPPRAPSSPLTSLHEWPLPFFFWCFRFVFLSVGQGNQAIVYR